VCVCVREREREKERGGVRPVVIMASNRGMARIRGTALSTHCRDRKTKKG
jgi:hypothetical protein